MEKILDFILRIVLGTLAMLLVNSLLKRLGIPILVGVNGLSVLTCGILGFPGLAVLYVFAFYRIL